MAVPPSDPAPPPRKSLLDIYSRLREAFGHQGWWPASSALEVVVGAVLTQNTSWRNVEKALRRLHQASPTGLDAADILRMPEADLADLIRPAGYFNVKARRLRAVMVYLSKTWDGRPEAMGEAVTRGERELDALRRELLAVHGVGEETADSILLYAAGLPTFVCDAYTRRVFTRLGRLPEGDRYETMRRMFMDELPLDAGLFNDYHAQIVRLGGSHCRPRDPECGTCPLRPCCDHGRRVTTVKNS